MIEESLEAAERIRMALDADTSGCDRWTQDITIEDMRMMLQEYDRRGREIGEPHISDHEILLSALAYGLARSGGRFTLHFVPGLEGEDYIKRRWMAGIEIERDAGSTFAVGEGSRQVMRQVLSEVGWLS